MISVFLSLSLVLSRSLSYSLILSHTLAISFSLEYEPSDASAHAQRFVRGEWCLMRPALHTHVCGCVCGCVGSGL